MPPCRLVREIRADRASHQIGVCRDVDVPPAATTSYSVTAAYSPAFSSPRGACRDACEIQRSLICRNPAIGRQAPDISASCIDGSFA